MPCTAAAIGSQRDQRAGSRRGMAAHAAAGRRLGLVVDVRDGIDALHELLQRGLRREHDRFLGADRVAQLALELQLFLAFAAVAQMRLDARDILRRRAFVGDPGQQIPAFAVSAERSAV